MLMLLIALAAAVSLGPVVNNQFVWDDFLNLVDNPHYRGLGCAQLRWMFTTWHDANYHPLCWLSFGVDYLIWKLNPAGYHLTNLVLHLFNAMLVYVLICVFLTHTRDENGGAAARARTRIGAAAGALFFALHPLRVEPVNCISCRGDVLSALFLLLTMLAYLKMTSAPSAAGRQRWYLLALSGFALSLLSRAWGITLPVVLLLLDVYPLGRLRAKDGGRPRVWLLIEKAPFFLLALGAAALAFGAKMGSMREMTEHGIMDRLVQALYGLWFYPYKTLVPLGLSPLYPLNDDFNPFTVRHLLAAAAVLGLTLWLLLERRRRSWALTSWLCYGVTVSPLLGLVQAGPQMAADRYCYVAGLPFAVLFGAGVRMLWHRCRGRAGRLRGPGGIALGTWAVLSVLGMLSWHQTRIWHDSLTVWSRAIAVEPANPVAYLNRGVFLREQSGDLQGALADFSAAIRYDPNNANNYYNRALLREQLQDASGAMEDYNAVIRLQPDHARAYNNRGGLLKQRGDLSDARADFDRAILLNPSCAEAYANRGMLRRMQADSAGACRDLRRSASLAPPHWQHRQAVERILAELCGR